MGHTLPLDTRPNGVRKLRNTAPAKRDQVWPESFHHEPRISDVICEPRRFRSRQVRSTLFLVAFSARSPFLTGPPNSPRYQALPFTLSDPFYIPIETKYSSTFFVDLASTLAEYGQKCVSIGFALITKARYNSDPNEICPYLTRHIFATFTS